MGLFGGVLVLIGALLYVAGFLGIGGLFTFAGGFGVLAVGCILCGLAAIEHTVRQTNKQQIDITRAGFESLWRQLDYVRRAPTALPDVIPVLNTNPPPLPAETGKCPACGIRRSQADAVCPKCGSTRPVEFT